MFEFWYDIVFFSYQDLDNFEDALIKHGIDYEIGGIYCDRLYIFGDWDDADEAEWLMHLYCIDFYFIG